MNLQHAELQSRSDCAEAQIGVDGVPGFVDGDFSAWRLILPIPARTTLHQTSARISIGPLEHLSVIALKRGAVDPRCAVTWSAWKP